VLSAAKQTSSEDKLRWPIQMVTFVVGDAVSGIAFHTNIRCHLCARAVF